MNVCRKTNFQNNNDSRIISVGNVFMGFNFKCSRKFLWMVHKEMRKFIVKMVSKLFNCQGLPFQILFLYYCRYCLIREWKPHKTLLDLALKMGIIKARSLNNNLTKAINTFHDDLVLFLHQHVEKIPPSSVMGKFDSEIDFLVPCIHKNSDVFEIININHHVLCRTFNISTLFSISIEAFKEAIINLSINQLRINWLRSSLRDCM